MRLPVGTATPQVLESRTVLTPNGLPTNFTVGFSKQKRARSFISVTKPTSKKNAPTTENIRKRIDRRPKR